MGSVVVVHRLSCPMACGILISCSVQFSCSFMSDSLRPHALQHSRLSCLSPTPGSCSNSCPLSWWCHPTISSWPGIESASPALEGGFLITGPPGKSCNLRFWKYYSLRLKSESKETKPGNPKGNQLWILIGRTEAEAEAPILWPPDVTSWPVGKALMLWKIKSRRRRGR